MVSCGWVMHSPLSRSLPWSSEMSDMVDASIAGKLDLIGGMSPGRLDVYNAIRCDQLFQDFVFRSAAIEIAGRITRSQVMRCYFDVTFCKIGTDLASVGAAATSRYHDIASFAFEGLQLPSPWLALTGVSSDAGPLVFVLISHVETGIFQTSGHFVGRVRKRVRRSRICDRFYQAKSSS